MISCYKFKFYHEKLFHTSCNFLCATNALLVICHPESGWHMTGSEQRLQAFTYAWHIITTNYSMISCYKFKFYHEKLFHTSCNFLCATNALLVICHPESGWHMTSFEPRLQALYLCLALQQRHWLELVTPLGFGGKLNYPFFLLREGW